MAPQSPHAQSQQQQLLQQQEQQQQQQQQQKVQPLKPERSRRPGRPSNRQRGMRLSPLWQAIFTLLTLFSVVTMVVPFLNVLAVSFTERSASMAPGIRLWPEGWTTEAYTTAWNRVKLSQAFFNSLLVASVAVVIEMFFASLAAYVLIQRELPFRKALMTIILLTMMMPGDLTLIATYSLNRQLGLLNSYTGLILNGLISAFAIVLMRNYFRQVPESLAESARIDGGSESRIFLTVYLPLSLPGLASVSFLEFIGKWNSLMLPTSIITDPHYYTLPMALQQLTMADDSTSGVDYVAPNARMAAIVISVLPLIVFYIFTQRHLIEGLSMGAEKG